MKRAYLIKTAKSAASIFAMFVALLAAQHYTHVFRYDVFKCQFYEQDWHYVVDGLSLRAACPPVKTL